MSNAVVVWLVFSIQKSFDHDCLSQFPVVLSFLDDHGMSICAPVEHHKSVNNTSQSPLRRSHLRSSQEESWVQFQLFVVLEYFQRLVCQFQNFHLPAVCDAQLDCVDTSISTMFL